MPEIRAALFEFHVSRQSRDLYQFDETLFSLSGNVLFANFRAVRSFTQRINSRRDLVTFPEKAIQAGQLNAMGLIDEILHYVMAEYRRQRNPLILQQAMEKLQDEMGEEVVNETLRQFCDSFPPVAVYRREVSLEDYLDGKSTLDDGSVLSNRVIALEELILLWTANANPAFSPFLELFDDQSLKKNSAYLDIIHSLQVFFDRQPSFGPENQNLLEMLRTPAIRVPHSLSGQLEYIRTHWGYLLGKYLYLLLRSLDLIREEEKAFFAGPGPSRVYEFAGMEREAERFSPDREWMPNLVLIAKNSYVWLDQISKKYKRAITHLDEIPDEELDTLARWGFSGLWLIGLWERSPASQRIKQLRGNADAVASAYSLFNYDIAADLGGDEAYRNLRDRAWKRGIRLASDMVPNHMGIDSPWVIEHPDWFVALDYSPFPTYTFNGTNLSWDQRVGIYLEDHYYDSTDAAVVFKRVDFWTGSEKYIYHGNDGTSMPWNDTAQLDYMQSEVREAIIQTILHVARKFPVIRFDAAMTLAKKHYQRLWFPEPGTGGAIPSRAEHGLTKEQFDAAFPQEFWREVVDRVAKEMPDTLLLAEAFWLMEGYFVRTLGMHRVYNSAFMNMLRDEKNQEYRLVIKNTVEFDPEILKRYVNFMNNPDERTAVDQFGKSDKYFGVCVMLATMPGLPMFGHGQIEGFAEKYGMEFQRAYWDERPDGYLVERHEREIFPLLRRRYLFAEVKNFLLYDFYTTEGYVNEDVFAYSNQTGNDYGLVLFHNKFNNTRGWIRTSAAYSVKTGQDERTLVQKSLGDGLGLKRDADHFVIFRDHINSLEYIRNCEEIHENGLYAELGAYKYMVLLDFREVEDNQWHHYAQLANYLNGRGVPKIDEALKEIFLQPVHTPFRELVNPGSLQWLIDNRTPAKANQEVPAAQTQAIDEAEFKFANLLQEANQLNENQAVDIASISKQFHQELEALLKINSISERFPLEKSRKYASAVKYMRSGPPGQAALTKGEPAVWGTLLSYLSTRKLGATTGAEHVDEQSRTLIDEWLLGKIIATALQDMDVPDTDAWRFVAGIKILVSHQKWLDLNEKQKRRGYSTLRALLNDVEVQRYLGINRYQDVLWFNHESFEQLLWWLFTTCVIDLTAGHPGMPEADDASAAQVAQAIVDCYDTIKRLQKSELESKYQVEKLLEAAKVA
jgi:glycosidase